MEHRGLITFIVLFYVGLATYSAQRHRPEVDEGLFADPAYNLVHNGYMGSAVIRDVGHSGINRRTYYIHPLHILVESAWFSAVGFGLRAQRGLSMMFGLLALFGWYYFVRRLTGNRVMATLALMLMATDYFFLLAASSGRPDMATAAYGVTAYAGYLWLRERHLALAVVLSQSCVMLSGLTHPMGTLHFSALLCLILMLDRNRLSWRHLCIGLVPYVIGAAAWGAYIGQSPAQFLLQYRANSLDGDRFRGLREPWKAFLFEFERYRQSFGFGGHSSGHAGPIRLKALILVGYLTGLFGVGATSLRRERTSRILLSMFAVQFLILTFLDGQKMYYYLVHIVAFYLTFLSLFVTRLKSWNTVPARILAAGVVTLMSVSSGGIAVRAYQDTYHRVFLPAVVFVKARLGPGQTVNASSAYGFEFGFSPDRLVGDTSAGYRSGVEADFLIVDQDQQWNLDAYQRTQPEIWRGISQILSKYREVYDREGIRVYARR